MVKICLLWVATAVACAGPLAPRAPEGPVGPSSIGPAWSRAGTAEPTVVPTPFPTAIPTSRPTVAPPPMAAPPPAATPAPTVRPLTSPVRPVPEPTPETGAAVTFTIPVPQGTRLAHLGPEIEEVLDAARRYPTSRLYLAAYVDPEEAPDAKQASEGLVVAMAGYLASRGIEANRISGRGMGSNPAVGRAVVISLDVDSAPLPSGQTFRERSEHLASREAPERLPSQNLTFKQVAGRTLYRVAPGDQLQITQWFIEGPRALEIPVSPRGTITFELVRDVPVEGLTVEEIERTLSDALLEFYRDPRITVKVASYGGRFVTVIAPGGAQTLALRGRTTLLDLLTRNEIQGINRDFQERSGGQVGRMVSDFGLPDMSRVRVVRGTESYSFNLFQILLEDDWSANFVLDDGDLVYIPTLQESRSYVFVLGAVAQPGIYPIRTRMNAVEAIYAAGGPTGAAYLPHARIIRGDLEQPLLIPADVDLVITQGNLNAQKELQGGDVVFVPATRIANWNAFINDLTPSINFLTLPLRAAFVFDILQD